MNPNKYILDIARKGLHGGDVILWSACLHQGSKATIINDLEWPVIFRDPVDKFSTVNCFSDIHQMNK
jgi:hypothetical protein